MKYIFILCDAMNGMGDLYNIIDLFHVKQSKQIFNERELTLLYLIACPKKSKERIKYFLQNNHFNLDRVYIITGDYGEQVLKNKLVCKMLQQLEQSNPGFLDIYRLSMQSNYHDSLENSFYNLIDDNGRLRKRLKSLCAILSVGDFVRIIPKIKTQSQYEVIPVLNIGEHGASCYVKNHNPHTNNIHFKHMGFSPLHNGILSTEVEKPNSLRKRLKILNEISDKKLVKMILGTALKGKNFDTTEVLFSKTAIVISYCHESTLASLYFPMISQSQWTYKFQKIVFCYNKGVFWDKKGIENFFKLVKVKKITVVDSDFTSKTYTCNIKNNYREIVLISMPWISKGDRDKLLSVSAPVMIVSGDKTFEESITFRILPILALPMYKLANLQNFICYLSRSESKGSNILVQYFGNLFKIIEQNHIFVEATRVPNYKVSKDTIYSRLLALYTNTLPLLNDETFQAWDKICNLIHNSRNFYSKLPDILNKTLTIFDIYTNIIDNNLREALRELNIFDQCEKNQVVESYFIKLTGATAKDFVRISKQNYNCGKIIVNPIEAIIRRLYAIGQQLLKKKKYFEARIKFETCLNHYCDINHTDISRKVICCQYAIAQCLLKTGEEDLAYFYLSNIEQISSELKNPSKILQGVIVKAKEKLTKIPLKYTFCYKSNHLLLRSQQLLSIDEPKIPVSKKNINYIAGEDENENDDARLPSINIGCIIL